MRERLEQWSAGIPFKVKLGMVWGVIALIVVFSSRWPTSTWSGCSTISGSSPRVCPGRSSSAGWPSSSPSPSHCSALGRLSNSAVAQSVQLLHLLLPRHTADRADVPHLPRPAPARPANLPGLRGFPDPHRPPGGDHRLGLNYGAYMTEIFRAGIQSVGHGQVEAAEALGMTYRQRMRRIVLPRRFGSSSPHRQRVHRHVEGLGSHLPARLGGGPDGDLPTLAARG